MNIGREGPQAHFQQEATTVGEENDEGLSSLFSLYGEGARVDASSTEDDSIQTVSICPARHNGLDDTESASKSLSFQVRLPPDVGTLFAHRVWSGSKVMAEFLASNQQYVKGKRTIELGAGTGIPSLVALACGSTCSILTDYPDESVLQSIRETVGLNWEACGRPVNRVAVIGHQWGSSVEEVHRTTANLLQLPSGTASVSFDTVLLSECLWMHRSHRDLARSINQLLNEDRGHVVVTYGHHVPGCESADDAFFGICADNYGLRTVYQATREAEYMWNDAKTMLVHLRVLSRHGNIVPA